MSRAGTAARKSSCTSTITLDEMLATIDAITADDVLRVAQRIFVPGWAHMALVGPGLDRAAMEDLVSMWN